jgi:hypothetical protein
MTVTVIRPPGPIDGTIKLRPGVIRGGKEILPILPPQPPFITVPLPKMPTLQEVIDGFVGLTYYELMAYYWKPQQSLVYVGLFQGQIAEVTRYRRSHVRLTFRYSGDYLAEAGTLKPPTPLHNGLDETLYRLPAMQTLATGGLTSLWQDKTINIFGSLNRASILAKYDELVARIDPDPLDPDVGPGD